MLGAPLAVGRELVISFIHAPKDRRLGFRLFAAMPVALGVELHDGPDKRNACR